ncbi:hypothetical protein [Herbiconiux daphne]|uniref:Uncharacterized protein n=1 Tax=Herbiconiux daphne TaxID=2970914 RepID=A0ABT2H5B8_9MICO|nr:hypothetical protein [Herbiconiux daphne]MCS5735137.1 hypothetical protein [Herbiconiux daphne]
MARTSATTHPGPVGDSPFWVDGALSPAGARECLRTLDADPGLEALLAVTLPAGTNPRTLLEQRRDGELGSADERRLLGELERVVYGPGGDPDAGERLHQLLATLHDRGRGLDAAVRRAGVLERSALAAGADGSHHPDLDELGAPDVGPADLPAGERPRPATPTSPRRRRVLYGVALGLVSAVAVAAASVIVVQALTPRPSLEVFTKPGDLPDGPAVTQVIDIVGGADLGAGPIRYVGSIGEATFFATLVQDTFHNPDDPREGVCLVGHFGDQVAGTVSVNCVERDVFTERGVTLPLTLTPSGEYAGINVDVDGASQGAAWGPTGDLRQIGVDELRALNE